MPSPNQTGVKQVYLDHLFFDSALAPIAEAGAGVLRVDYMENVLGHRSGLNAAANQTAANISTPYSGLGTVPLKQNFRDEQNRGNQNQV